METGELRPELSMLSKKFGIDYFDRLYRDSSDRNSPGKIETYLRLIRRYTYESQQRPGLRRGGGQALSGKKRRSILLDIGCGYGRFLKAAEKDFETYGIDPSEFAINRAGKYAVNTKFEVATISSYEPRIKFDVIAAFDVLEHVPDVEKSVLKIKSWLKPKGIFFCVVPVYDGVFGTIGGWLDKDMTHLHKLSRWMWLEKFKKNFTIPETYGILRYSFSKSVYFHVMKWWLFYWGQAILVVMRK